MTAEIQSPSQMESQMTSPTANHNSTMHKKCRFGGAREISISLDQESSPNVSYMSKRTNE